MWGFIVLIIVVAVEAILILKWKVSTMALLYYMEIKQYTQPNEAEMEVCTAYAVRQILKV